MIPYLTPTFEMKPSVHSGTSARLLSSIANRISRSASHCESDWYERDVAVGRE